MTYDTLEVWLTIADFPAYEVSSLGRIRRSLPGKMKRPVTGVCLKPQYNRNGYQIIALQREAGERSVSISVIVCKAFHGPKPDPSYHAAHNNGIRDDNRAVNLRWATPKENAADCIVHGTRLTGDKHPSRTRIETRPRGPTHHWAARPETRVFGERHHAAKLKAEQIPDIRADKRSISAIARDYGVARSQIRCVKSGKTWAHVT